MTVAVDTDVLVHWAMAGTPLHGRARRFVDSLPARGQRAGLVPQVLWEFIHVCTDARRFERPFSMLAGIDLALELWGSPEVDRIVPDAAVVERALGLLRAHRLGRKRILDTVLAATLEGAGVKQLATFNPDDFGTFPFLAVTVP